MKFTIKTIHDRLKAKGDLFNGVLGKTPLLPTKISSPAL